MNYLCMQYLLVCVRVTSLRINQFFGYLKKQWKTECRRASSWTIRLGRQFHLFVVLSNYIAKHGNFERL